MKILFLNGDVVFGIHPNHEDAENYEHIPHTLYDGDAEIRPGFLTMWNGNGVDYIQDPCENILTLEDAKALKIKELNEACRKAIVAGVPYDGHVFPSKDSDLLLLIAAEKTLLRYPQLPWDTLDAGPGSYILTVANYPGIREAFEDTRIAHQMRVNDLKALVEAATTPEELAAIAW